MVQYYNVRTTGTTALMHTEAQKNVTFQLCVISSPIYLHLFKIFMLNIQLIHWSPTAAISLNKLRQRPRNSQLLVSRIGIVEQLPQN